MKKNLIETAKNIVLSSKKNNSISFNDLWELVAKQEKLTAQQKDEFVSDFYIDLLEDPDFLKIDNELWTLRKLVSFDKYNQISKSLFNNNLSDDNEEDNYNEYMSDTEINEMKNKNKNKTVSLEIIDEDDDDNDNNDGDDYE